MIKIAYWTSPILQICNLFSKWTNLFCSLGRNNHLFEHGSLWSVSFRHVSWAYGNTPKFSRLRRDWFFQGMKMTTFQCSTRLAWKLRSKNVIYTNSCKWLCFSFCSMILSMMTLSNVVSFNSSSSLEFQESLSVISESFKIQSSHIKNWPPLKITYTKSNNVWLVKNSSLKLVHLF